MHPVGFLVVTELPNHLVPHQVVLMKLKISAFVMRPNTSASMSSASPIICWEYLLPPIALFKPLPDLYPAAHTNGYTEVITHRLEYMFCYSLEILDLPVFGCVIDTQAAGRV